MLILTTEHLDITLDHFFIFIYSFNFIHFTLILVTWSLLLFVCFRKVNLCACENRVKAN